MTEPARAVAAPTLLEGSSSPLARAAKALTSFTTRPTRRQLRLMLLINVANLVCHLTYSVMDSFFAQTGAANALSPELVAFVFAAFPAVVVVCSPLANWLMSRFGAARVYAAGLATLAVATANLGTALRLPGGTPFAVWCVGFRLVQGLGSTLEEAAAYALIATLAGDQVSFYLGLTECSTGLGYMLGPPIGGLLFTVGGFSAPFLIVSAALLVCSLGIAACMRAESVRDAVRPEERAEERAEEAREEAREQESDGGGEHAAKAVHLEVGRPTTPATPMGSAARMRRRDSTPGTGSETSCWSCAQSTAGLLRSRDGLNGGRSASHSLEAGETPDSRTELCLHSSTETTAPAAEPLVAPAALSIFELLASSPQVGLISLAAMVANLDYAFLQPTLGPHAMLTGHAKGAEDVGLLFAIASMSYTIGCPLAGGVLANKSCLGTRATILLGILIQSIGFSCLAYSAGFRLDSRLVDPAASATAILGSRWSLRLGLLLLGLGDALAMTPVMEDIMTALRGGAAGAENDPAAVNAVGALLTASFGLGQVVGPLLGTELAESFGFGRAAALMGAFLLCLLPVLFVCGRRWPARVAPQGIPSRGRIRRAGFALVEPVAEEGVEVPSLRSI